MLSDQEKAELLEMAGSDGLRAEFRRLRAASRESAPDLDRLLAFLTFAAKALPVRRSERPQEPFSNVLL